MPRHLRGPRARSTQRCGGSSPGIGRSSCSTTSWGCRCRRSAACPGHPSRYGQVAAALRPRGDAPHGPRRSDPRPVAGHGRAAGMTTERRFEQDLPDILRDLYLGPIPLPRRTPGADEPHAAAPALDVPRRWLPMSALLARRRVAPVRPATRAPCPGARRAPDCAPSRSAYAGSQPRYPRRSGWPATGRSSTPRDGDILRARHGRRPHRGC